MFQKSVWRTFSLSVSLSFLLIPTSHLTAANKATFSIKGNVRKPIIIPASLEELEQRAAESPDRIPLGPVANTNGGAKGLDWRFLGPKPILNEYWSGYADASGRVSSIIVDPLDAHRAYIAGAQGGVWRTTDGGISWTPLTDHLSSLASGALAFDPLNPDVIYYGTGEQHYSGDSFYGDGLFKTTDGGTTWSKIATKATVGSYIARIIVKPANSDTIHLASDRGYLRSTDGGNSWSLILNPSQCNDLAVSPMTPNVVFAAFLREGIYRSTNSGADWVKLTNGLPSGGFARINMAISTSGNVLYASFVNDTTGGLLGMYKTTDGGDSWFNLPNTPNYLGGQGWYDNCIIVDPTDSNICYAGGVFPYGGDIYGLIRTTDGGNSWADITIGIDGSQLHPDQHCLAIGPDGTLWVGNDGGVWKTTDNGQHWINLNNNLGLTQFYTLGIHPTDSTFLLGGNQDNGTVRYEGNLGWPQVMGGDGGPVAIEWDSPNIYYTTYVRMTYLTKWDNGTYIADVTGPWSGERASWCNGPLVVDPNQPNTLLVGTYRVWRTTDSGASWDSISNDLTGGGVLRALAVAQGNSNIIYTGSSDGRVYLTTDGGATWNPRYSGLPWAPIPDIVLHPSNWQIAYLCVDRSSGGRVYRTTNAGVDWTDITGDLPNGLRGISLTINFSTPSPLLFLGTDYGVYFSPNNGTNWTKEGDNLPSLAIYDLGYDVHNHLLVAATHGRGMWRATVSDTIGIQGDQNLAQLPQGFSLSQNYPNPFNATTLIRYAVPAVSGQQSTVSLKIYNILGQKVATLVNEKQPPGYRAVSWDAGDMASGIYFYRLQAGEFVQTKRLLLLK